jgi:hypothetical protein
MGARPDGYVLIGISTSVLMLVDSTIYPVLIWLSLFNTGPVNLVLPLQALRAVLKGRGGPERMGAKLKTLTFLCHKSIVLVCLYSSE